MKKITVKKAYTLFAICRKYEGVKSKFGYACKRNKAILEKHLAKVEESIADKKNELASVDDTTAKNLILDKDGGYTYSKENNKTLNKFVSDQYEKEIEIEFYTCQDYSSVNDNFALIVELAGTIVDKTEEELYELESD